MRWKITVALLLAASGCTSPDKANIELRKINQDLKEKLSQVQGQEKADRARIAGLEKSAMTLPVLPQDRLDKMFVVHAIDIDRLTGFESGMLEVYVTPTDQEGDPIKATGKFVIDAYDLSKGKESHVGQWTFGPDDCLKSWRGLLVHAYVFQCPWPVGAAHDEITLRVSFTDELSNRTFDPVQKVLKAPAP